MLPVIQTSFITGELSPSFLGRVDKPQYKNGASTMRNCFVRYTGGASSRAGLAYVGMCRQGAPNIGGTGSINIPPRDINFQYSINQGFVLEFGNYYMRVKYNGGYVTEQSVPVTSVSSAGLFTTSVNHGYSVGDWVYDAGNTGFNGLTWIIASTPASNTFTVTDLFGNVISTATASTAGTIARIYNSASPYAAADLPYLKFTQSANLMNLVCINQQTNIEYPPYTLTRVSNTNWAFAQVAFAAAIAPPASIALGSTSSTTANTWYSYVVTAVDANGNESVASANGDVLNNDIAINAGTNVIGFSQVAGAVCYNIYAATPQYTQTPYANPGFVGASYGLIGTSFGNVFNDTNIIKDFTKTPPIHSNPFARGTITGITPTASGSGYTQSTVGYSITTTTGSGFVGTPIIQGGAFTGFYIKDGGGGYAATDTIHITGGSGATASLTVGPRTGTYPGTVQYFQQRLVYANTIDQPNTYFMSQSGLYSNFDSSIPTVSSDAIIGTPWGQQINGIQFFVPTISGLLALTGNGVWLISGGSTAAITPSDQNAQAQAQIGCSAVIPPLYLNLHILYVQAKNSIVRDVAYNFMYNVFQGTDITVLSNHLFEGRTILGWAYSEEPFKVVWAVRDDGSMISLTYLKEQEIQAWAKHDTNGLFVCSCSIVEPPVDAVYVITKRYIIGHSVWVYYSERMDNRDWNLVDECFCVDAGIAYPVSYPNATLSPVAGNGTSNISSTNVIVGGSGYTAPIATAYDDSGKGSGATFSVTVVSGVITAVAAVTQGSNYTQGRTTIIITDATGRGAVIQPIITNYVTFNASSSVFNSGMIGDILNIDGGKATIVSQTGNACIADVTIPLTSTIANDPNTMPIPATAGNWYLGTLTTTVSGLNHLEGMSVTGLADGGAIVPQTVTNGAITLPNAASNIVVGLPFVAQLQTMYLESGTQVSQQGKRKDIQSATVRFESSRGVAVGTNQPDASMQPNNAIIPWSNMKEIKERNALITAGSAVPLFTGDSYIIVPGDWATNGQLAMQQSYPLPMNVLAVFINYTPGDNPA